MLNLIFKIFNDYLIYWITFVLVLVILFFYLKQRVNIRDTIIILILNLSFPYFYTYNNIYYNERYKGIFFIFLILITYFLFFKLISNKPDKHKSFSYFYTIFLGFSIALITRLRSVFIILILMILYYLNINFYKNKLFKNLILFDLSYISFVILFFLISKISIYHYFLIDKFSIFSLKAFIDNLFLYPRESMLLLILLVWLLFSNIVFLKFGNSQLKTEIHFILFPEIIIFFIYLILFSSKNILHAATYLGLFPFIPLNIYYIYLLIKDFSLKIKITILLLFSLAGFVSNFFYYL